MLELNQLQKDLLKKYKNGEFDQFTATEEERSAFSAMIDDAMKLEEQTGEDSGDDLILWYMGKQKL